MRVDVTSKFAHLGFLDRNQLQTESSESCDLAASGTSLISGLQPCDFLHYDSYAPYIFANGNHSSLAPEAKYLCHTSVGADLDWTLTGQALRLKTLALAFVWVGGNEGCHLKLRFLDWIPPCVMQIGDQRFLLLSGLRLENALADARQPSSVKSVAALRRCSARRPSMQLSVL